MAQIKPEPIVEHLRSQMRRALEDAVREVIPDVEFDSYELFRVFKRRLRSKCQIWERVPDQCIKAKVL
jgi:hypothetical protein